MQLFCSRRTYNASTHKFTNNVAALTRFVMIDGPTGSGIISQQDWLRLVEGEAGNGEVVLWVHGFNTTQPAMLARMGVITGGLAANGYGGVVVGFDWPSDGVLLGYDADLRDAKAVAPFLVPEVIRPLLASGLTVHVIAHSMGAYLTLRGFSGEGDLAEGESWSVGQVAFIAADVEAEAMRAGAWGALVLQERCVRVTNYYSTADRVLALSGGLIHGGRVRSGQVGLPPVMPSNAVDLYTTAQFRTHVPPDQQQKMAVTHDWYYGDAGVLRDLTLTLQGRADVAMPTRQDASNGDRALLT